MTSRRSLLVGMAVLTCAGLAACGNGPPGASPGAVAGAGPAPAGPPNTIVIKNFTFKPAQLTVAPGAVVTVDDQDTAAHTVTAKENGFDTGNLAANSRGSFTAPSQPGEYSYICDIHQYMKGTLTVKAP